MLYFAICILLLSASFAFYFLVVALFLISGWTPTHFAWVLIFLEAHFCNPLFHRQASWLQFIYFCATINHTIAHCEVVAHNNLIRVVLVWDNLIGVHMLLLSFFEKGLIICLCVFALFSSLNISLLVQDTGRVVQCPNLVPQIQVWALLWICVKGWLQRLTSYNIGTSSCKLGVASCITLLCAMGTETGLPLHVSPKGN